MSFQILNLGKRTQFQNERCTINCVSLSRGQSSCILAS